MASWLGYRGNYQNLLGPNPYTNNTSRGNRRGLTLYNSPLSYGARALGRNALTLAPQRLALGAPALGGLYGGALGTAGLNGLAYSGLGASALGLGSLGVGGLGLTGLGVGGLGAGGLGVGGLGVGGLGAGAVFADGCLDCITDPITGEHLCSACANYSIAPDQLVALEGILCVCPNCCQAEINGYDPYALGGNLGGGLVPAGLGGLGLGGGGFVRGCGGLLGDPYGRAGLLSAGGLGARGLLGRRVGLARGGLGTWI